MRINLHDLPRSLANKFDFIANSVSLRNTNKTTPSQTVHDYHETYINYLILSNKLYKNNTYL